MERRETKTVNSEQKCHILWIEVKLQAVRVRVSEKIQMDFIYKCSLQFIPMLEKEKKRFI